MSRSPLRRRSRRLRNPSGRPLAVLAGVALACGVAAPSRAAPPPRGECPSVTGVPLLEEGKGLVDAPPVQLREGMTIQADQLLMLRRLLPAVIWQHREAFFYEGMRMEIGGCNTPYPAFGPYKQATERFRGQAKLDDEGNLLHYTAGLPFPPEDIDPKAPDAALRWAWDLEERWRGAGYRGSFRITEIPSRLGGILTFDGRVFLLQISHRADQAENGYRVSNQKDLVWAAGGEFLEPFDARGLAWRQFRPRKSLRDRELPDDIFVYVPTMRKQRRAATNWVDGLYMPTYTSGNEGTGGGMVYGTGDSISPTAGISIAASQDMGRGLTGISLRPNEYVWRYLGEQAVIAPLNAARPGYPLDDKRNFGFSGLSFASDRWDVRWAVIIEGARKTQGSDIRTVEIWIDWATQQPLYWITRTGRRRLMDIGILVHRFTGDVLGSPEWPGGIPANVFQPVGETFYNALAGGGGWRRESYDLRSVPPDDGEIRTMTSADGLSRGR